MWRTLRRGLSPVSGQSIILRGMWKDLVARVGEGRDGLSRRGPRVLEGKEKTLREAIETGALGKGEVFEKEMQGAMQEARVSDGLITFYEICYCPSPLLQEREY